MTVFCPAKLLSIKTTKAQISLMSSFFQEQYQVAAAGMPTASMQRLHSRLCIVTSSHYTLYSLISHRCVLAYLAGFERTDLRDFKQNLPSFFFSIPLFTNYCATSKYKAEQHCCIMQNPPRTIPYFDHVRILYQKLSQLLNCN
jgi:hypothetical protein